MKIWIAVLIAVVVVVAIIAIALWAAKQRKVERQRAEALEVREQAETGHLEADRREAAAEEHAARAKREVAEAERERLEAERTRADARDHERHADEVDPDVDLRARDDDPDNVVPEERREAAPPRTAP